MILGIIFNRIKVGKDKRRELVSYIYSYILRNFSLLIALHVDTRRYFATDRFSSYRNMLYTLFIYIFLKFPFTTVLLKDNSIF